MSDPTYSPIDYLMAHDVVGHIEQNAAIQFQMCGSQWSAEEMQQHVNDRAALLRVQKLLLDAGERTIPENR